MSRYIQSHEWRALLNLPEHILLAAIEIMADNTEIFECDGGAYPRIDFAIGLAMDKAKENKKENEKASEVKANEMNVSDDEESQRKNYSPKTRELKIREARMAWLDKITKSEATSEATSESTREATREASNGVTVEDFKPRRGRLANRRKKRNIKG